MSNPLAVRMTFDESYGPLPRKTLRLIKAKNVSPADFDAMLDQFMFPDTDVASDRCVVLWACIDAHIVDNSTSGMYVPRFF